MALASMTVVEAGAADCLYRSAVQADGSRVNVAGDMLTIMAGLACGEANTVSFDILKNHADAFVSCPRLGKRKRNPHLRRADW